MSEPHDASSIQQAMRDRIPHAGAIGIEFISMGEGRAVMRVPWREAFVIDPESQVIASGIATALIDQACGMAINATRERPTTFVTLDLRIDYMRPAAPRAGLTCEAECYKVTRSVSFVRAKVWDADDADLVATAQATFILAKKGGGK